MNGNPPQILILGEWPDGSPNSGGGPRKFNRRLCETLEAAGISLRNPRRSTQSSSRIRQLVAILQEALRSAPAIVHVTTDGFHVGAALLCKLLWRSKIVYSVHSLVRVWPEVRNSTPLIDRIRRWIVERTMVRFCDCAVFPSRHYQEASDAAGYRFRRRETVPHGSDTIAGTRPRTAPPAPVCFGVFGPGLRVKGVERLAGIIEELCDLGSIRWIGYDASDPHQMTTIVDQIRNQSQCIRFEPPVPPAKVDNELARIAITLMPSEQESFGIVALESAAAGVPVIVSPTTGVAEIVKSTECGAVVDFSQPGQLKKAVLNILENYPAFSASAIVCGQSFSWSRAAQGYQIIYQSLINQPCHSGQGDPVTLN